jgi:hypothetical protein
VESDTEFKLSVPGIFKFLREGRLRRYKRWGDRRTFVDRRELSKLLRPRVVRAPKSKKGR